MISRCIHVATDFPALVLTANEPELPTPQPPSGRRAVLNGGLALAFLSSLTRTLCRQDPHVEANFSESRVWRACLAAHFANAARLPV